MRLKKKRDLHRFWFFIGVLLGVLLAEPLAAQQQAGVAAINYHIKLANESFHGMLVIHRLLENFNQEVNKYVDLQSGQINFYGNEDLPPNIFLDQDHWFYDPSPYAWYEKCERNSTLVPNELRSDLMAFRKQMKSIMDSLNQLRFEIDRTLKSRNMKALENQKLIYSQLETGVRLFDRAFEGRQRLQKMIDTWSANYSHVQATEWILLHKTNQQLLENIRFNKKGEVAKQHQILSNIALPSISFTGTRQVSELVNEITEYSGKYLQQHPIDSFYRLYGDYYYYLNVELLNRYNRYGNGLASIINETIEKQPGLLLLLEEPPLYKVVYPANADINPFKASQEAVIQTTPETLKNRKIIKQQDAVKVDDVQLTLRIYDHMEQDGDVVSLNFNGVWILDNYLLTRKPKILYVRLNPRGQNFLILHAHNVGSRPPNTVAVEYTYQGEVQRIILNSDLNQSELVELTLNQMKIK